MRRWLHRNRDKHIRLMRQARERAEYALFLKNLDHPNGGGLHQIEAHRLVGECGCPPSQWPAAVQKALR